MKEYTMKVNKEFKVIAENLEQALYEALDKIEELDVYDIIVINEKEIDEE
jgi:hypothetical protein